MEESPKGWRLIRKHNQNSKALLQRITSTAVLSTDQTGIDFLDITLIYQNLFEDPSKLLNYQPNTVKPYVLWISHYAACVLEGVQS